MRKAGTVNTGLENWESARQIGTAHSSSVFSSMSGPGKCIAAMLEMKAGHTEDPAAVQGKAEWVTGEQWMTGQHNKGGGDK